MAWTAPRTWVAGEKPSASTLNTHIRDNFKAIGDARTSYASTLGNSTQGNGTIAAASAQSGKHVEFSIKFTLGSTSAITGSPTFTLPVAATGSRTFGGVALYWDSSTTTQKVGFWWNSGASTISFRDDAGAALSSANPFTWATSDEIGLSGEYEAA